LLFQPSPPVISQYFAFCDRLPISLSSEEVKEGKG